MSGASASDKSSSFIVPGHFLSMASKIPVVAVILASSPANADVATGDYLEGFCGPVFESSV